MIHPPPTQYSSKIKKYTPTLISNWDEKECLRIRCYVEFRIYSPRRKLYLSEIQNYLIFNWTPCLTYVRPFLLSLSFLLYVVPSLFFFEGTQSVVHAKMSKLEPVRWIRIREKKSGSKHWKKSHLLFLRLNWLLLVLKLFIYIDQKAVDFLNSSGLQF